MIFPFSDLEKVLILKSNHSQVKVLKNVNFYDYILFFYQLKLFFINFRCS